MAAEMLQVVTEEDFYDAIVLHLCTTPWDLGCLEKYTRQQVAHWGWIKADRTVADALFGLVQHTVPGKMIWVTERAFNATQYLQEGTVIRRSMPTLASRVPLSLRCLLSASQIQRPSPDLLRQGPLHERLQVHRGLGLRGWWAQEYGCTNRLFGRQRYLEAYHARTRIGSVVVGLRRRRIGSYRRKRRTAAPDPRPGGAG